MSQDHLPPWIPLSTAFRWVLSAIDEDTADAYEAIHFHTSGRVKLRVPQQRQALDLMDAGEQFASDAWQALLKALSADDIQADGVEQGGADISLRGIDWTRMDGERTRGDKDIVVRQDGRIVSLVRLKTDQVRELVASLRGPVLVRDEKNAVTVLRDLLIADKDLSKAKAKAALKAARIPFTGAGFETRIWGDAREAAKLPRLAKGGAKKRKSQT